MEKQLLAIISTLLIITGITACSSNSLQDIEDKSVNKETPITNIPFAADTAEYTENAICDTENNHVDNITSIYGETDIPDIPCGNADNEGKANTNLMEVRDALKESIDSMIFETHTLGNYTVHLVGDNVRTDKKRFPNSIYVQSLRIEVEKNGEKLEGNGNYNDTVIYVSECREYRLLIDKIGSYIDIYELENPVIAMRYYYDNVSERTVKNAVEFATIQNSKLLTGFISISDKDTGIILNPNGTSNNNMLILNPEKGNCRVNIFSAEEFDIINEKTLIDNSAGIEFVFDFSDPSKMELYTAKKIQ